MNYSDLLLSLTMPNYGNKEFGLFLTATLLIVILVFSLIGLIIQILFILNLQKLLKEIRPENRKMEPGMVWLLIIPLFNLVWNFIVVSNVSQSIEAEYRSRSVNIEAKPTYSLGLAMAILEACCIVPFVNALASLPALICWIIYWVKTHEYKQNIRNFSADSVARTPETE